mgnify:FL=1
MCTCSRTYRPGTLSVEFTLPVQKPQKARGNQMQSEAIRGHQLLVIQRPTETIRCNQAAPQTKSDAIRRNQAQSGAIRRNQTQSACPEHCVSVFSCFGRAARACVLCFCVLGWHNGPVFCVFVFWQTPLKTQGGANRVTPHYLWLGSRLTRG